MKLYKVKATSFSGRFVFFEIALSMLLVPKETYTVTAGGAEKIVFPGSTLADVYQMLVTSFWHMVYAETRYTDKKIYRPSEWKYLIILPDDFPEYKSKG